MSRLDDVLLGLLVGLASCIPVVAVIYVTESARFAVFRQRLVAALRRAARQRGGPLPSIHVVDALLDERRELTGLPRLTRCLGNY